MLTSDQKWSIFLSIICMFTKSGAPFNQTHFTLFIQQVQDAKSSLNQVDTWLVVIEVYQSPGDLLLHVLLLLQLKHMLTTEKKQQPDLFICLFDMHKM